ncbi:unnamed protein product [Urochloa decumbens]|uniref:SMP domain-containing protein n=1 Tax=Urochloa decumbens TaxID=240449 RepID=A0ABC9EIH0_9POAL
MSQRQPVRGGDVYPPSADRHEARRQRDKAIGQGHEQSGAAAAAGLQVSETDLPAGRRMVTTSAGGQVYVTLYYTVLTILLLHILIDLHVIWSLLGTPLSLCLKVMAQFTLPVPGQDVAEATDAVTVGEALQAAPGDDRPVSLADAAAVQAAEMRATGLGGNLPGGVAAAAQRAAEANTAAEGKAAVRIRDVVGDAAAALPADKVATREDAGKVAAAAARNVGKKAGAGGKGSGVVEAVAAAADMNEGRMK